MAPYRPAAEVVRQKDRKNPIQLKRNATEKAGEKQQVKPSLYSKGKKKQPKHKTLAHRFFLVLHKHKCEKNSSYFGSLPEKKVSSIMYLLKKVSMKMPSFPILSWSVSSKSSRVTKSSSCKSKGGKTWVDLSQSSPYSNPSCACGSSRKGQQIV